ncbi:MAG: restriction endonuclease subunit S, partial [archaeon]
MKANWNVEKLGDICQIELGRTPLRGNKSFWDTNKTTTNVWLSIADLLNCEDNIVCDSKEYISNKGAEISKVVKKGTLLASFKLTLGRLAFAGKDLFTNEDIFLISTIDSA